jgi:hypothetical protein
MKGVLIKPCIERVRVYRAIYCSWKYYSRNCALGLPLEIERNNSGACKNIFKKFHPYVDL